MLDTGRNDSLVPTAATPAVLIPPGVRVLRGDAVPARVMQRLPSGASDWVDHVEAQALDPRRITAQEWARAIFEDQRPLAARVRAIGPLGVALSRPQPPGRVSGWRIAEEHRSWVMLIADRPLMIERVLVEVAEASVGLATALQFTHPLGRAAWAAAAGPHHLVAPRVLHRAVRAIGPP